MNIPVITIDGPSGTGKGTVSKLLATKLGWHFLDSGVLYRALAFALIKSPKIDLTDSNALENLLIKLEVSFPLNQKNICCDTHVKFLGSEVSKALRSEECGNMASKIAILKEVRAVLLDWQRTFKKVPGLVADGRDMGTVVFPDATLKIFLSARTEERALRRYKQLKECGINVNLDKILEDLTSRDERDTKRSLAPLKPADDAIIIDTTEFSIDEVLRKIMDYYGSM